MATHYTKNQMRRKRNWTVLNCAGRYANVGTADAHAIFATEAEPFPGTSLLDQTLTNYTLLILQHVSCRDEAEEKQNKWAENGDQDANNKTNPTHAGIKRTEEAL